ncbi:DDE-type integrase/transposase/recombinase [Lactobacillus sp. B4007]|uniref:DDE-type integrase/transposase/recombinase n=1 Tax=Lactobacillus sp. B4007 TaxID=2818032 RepID=UPI00226A1C4C|nr:hypothetical protein [Lactobacillus sp. B4007]MCX8725703.1 hypothetical protein [Lactobacillus sp. B4007]
MIHPRVLGQESLRQKFKTNRPYQKVVTDISEFRYGNKSKSERIYLSPFKDLYSGEIISYTIIQRPQTKYVLDGLKQVLAARLTYLT